MTDRYAVMGHPVAHSQSPFIHARFAEQTGEDLRYEAIDAPAGGFAGALAAFQRAGGRGLNVTLPFKEEACRLMQVLTPRAERAGAVNTVSFGADGSREGDNTDGAGLVRDLAANRGLVLRGSRLLLLGAGGSARGVLGPLLDAKPARVVVANRTAARARALVAHFGARGGRLAACGLDELGGEPFDLLINATSASLAGEVPAIPEAVLAQGGSCYDLMYGPRPTAFVRWGEAHGARIACDGLGMLVEQAAESFLRWRGVRPRTGPVIGALRALLGRPGDASKSPDSTDR